MRQMSALIVISGLTAVFAALMPARIAKAASNSAAGWNVTNCNGHTHIVYTPTWLAPTGQMANIMIMDRDHDNYTPLKLTVNSITESGSAGCGSGQDFNFPATPATNPIGGVVTTVVQVLAAQCKGNKTPRTYDINITCEHDGSNSTGTGIAPAINTIDLTVTVGGKPPAPQAPANPAEQ